MGTDTATATDDVYDKAGLADLIGYSTRWIEQRIKERRFPIPHLDGLGKKKRWSRAAVQKYLDGRR